jgi:hypothetical protein
MKLLSIISRILLLTFLFIITGCKQPAEPDETTIVTNDIIDKLSFYTRYAPSKIDIMPLTEFAGAGDPQQSKINIYVSLFDQFGCQTKSPGIFRFELYEYIPRSSEPKGKRAVFWPDVDLIDPVTNNDYWRDFLRAYEFNLPCESAGNQDYILQVTCHCPNGKRLSSEFALRKAK